MGLRARLVQPVDILPLVGFRVAFGLLMGFGAVRFWAYGWVEEQYIAPSFRFSYSGFSWVRVPPEPWPYVLLALVGLAALSVALGYRYRASMLVFFLSFTYLELLDKTYYLNHYYFVSCVALLLVFLPLAGRFSLDARRDPSAARTHVPAWTLAALRLQVGLVYFFAGLAKLRADWLFEAMPLRLWLPPHADMWLLGPLMREVSFAYAMSWTGALFDLSVPFLLGCRRTRPWAYSAVVGFHLLTWMLFPIGMFPWIMMAAALVFFDGSEWAAALRRLGLARVAAPACPPRQRGGMGPWAGAGLGLWFGVQLALPLRHHLAPGNVLWHETGYRFAWHVMLMEKTGMVTFRLRHGARERLVFPSQYLTPQQERQMATQPDMILEFAHYLADRYPEDGRPPAVYADAFVSLNGRASRRFIDPDVDLARQRPGFARPSWVLPWRE